RSAGHSSSTAFGRRFGTGRRPCAWRRSAVSLASRLLFLGTPPSLAENRDSGESDLSAGERRAGLEQRLQAAEDERPAAGDVLRGLRRFLEAVVRDSDERESAFVLDLPRDAACRLRCRLGVVERAPLVDEAVRRLVLAH